MIKFKKEKHLITRGTSDGEGINQQPESIVHWGEGGGGYMIHIQMTFKRQEAGLPDSQALLIGAFQHDWQLVVLSWNDRACLWLIKTPQLNENEQPSNPDQATQVSSVSSIRRFIFFNIYIKTHFTGEHENLAGCIHRSRAHVMKCLNCLPSITGTLYCYVKDRSCWWGNVATGFWPGGTLWWQKRAWPIWWGSSSEGWMEHLGKTLTVK